MSVDIVGNRIVHYPSNVDKFEFDQEVAAVFPDMAARSIPMYAEAHRLHVSLLLDRFLDQERTKVVDVGASRGEFFKEICNQLQWPYTKRHPRIDLEAIDSSAPMLTLLTADIPWVTPVVSKIEDLPPAPRTADIVCMMYVLQFIQSDADKLKALRWAYETLKPGGVLILGQKDTVTDTYAGMFADEYMRFRVRNGYTLGEIAAKTAALKNSMWPTSPAWLEDMCIQAGFIDYAVTSRWLQFSTSVCTKR